MAATGGNISPRRCDIPNTVGAWGGRRGGLAQSRQFCSPTTPCPCVAIAIAMCAARARERTARQPGRHGRWAGAVRPHAPTARLTICVHAATSGNIPPRRRSRWFQPSAGTQSALKRTLSARSHRHANRLQPVSRTRHRFQPVGVVTRRSAPMATTVLCFLCFLRYGCNRR